MRGQISTEYLFMVGIAFLVMLPAGYLFYSYTQGQAETVNTARITQAGSLIVSEAESMYTVGTESWTTVRVQFPDSVENVQAQGKEVTITYETQNGESQAVFFSRVNLSTTYPGGNVSQDFTPGYTELRVRSLGPTVEVRETIG